MFLEMLELIKATDVTLLSPIATRESGLTSPQTAQAIMKTGKSFSPVRIDHLISSPKADLQFLETIQG
ncbi:hypothetical protein [Synechococcus sp. M16CYN]|uniref:hypothetical protein n=1 Tax=Synechococcus sp. M16CYN TaxID=3103139 RepID=UPI003341EFF3